MRFAVSHSYFLAFANSKPTDCTHLSDSRHCELNLPVSARALDFHKVRSTLSGIFLSLSVQRATIMARSLRSQFFKVLRVLRINSTDGLSLSLHFGLGCLLLLSPTLEALAQASSEAMSVQYPDRHLRETCTDVLNIIDTASSSPNGNQRRGFSHKLNWDEPLDQSASGVCHSMVASEMLSQALGFQVSPASIAFNYKTERNFIMKFGELINPEATRPDYFTGSIGGAISSALKHGICREEDFSLWQLWGRLRHAELAEARPSDRETLVQICRRPIEVASGLDWTLISMRSENSEGPQNQPSLDGIDQVLNSGRIVGIDHNVWPLLNAQQREKTPTLFGILPIAGHSASLVGRRRHNGRCQYLYRNSWGKSCREYRQDLSCDRGHLWLDESEILRLTIYAYALMAKRP